MRGTSFPLGLRRPGCCGCRGDQAVAIRAQESVMWKRSSMRSLRSVAGTALIPALAIVRNASVEEELLGQRGQVPAAGFGDDDQVLDADPTQARVVQPRFHGDDVADLEDHVGLVDARVLVYLEPESVSRPVNESGIALDVPVRPRERAIPVLLE